MSAENLLRLMTGIIFLVGVSTSIYSRRKADVKSGGTVSVKDEGRPMFMALRLGGLVIWGSALAYLIHPAWMNWANLGLPDWLRWTGVGIGVVSDLLILWMFRSIGTGITPTVATRTNHQLVTSGPYRYIRHPLYTFGTLFFLAFGLMTDSWLMMGAAVVAFVLLAARVPNEEQHLMAKFGEEYRQYRESTGAFLPRLRPRAMPRSKSQESR